MVSFVAQRFASVPRARGSTDTLYRTRCHGADAILGAMRRSCPSQLISGLLVGVALLAASAAVRASPAQFTSYSRNSRNILEGNWQSCREADGQYSERVYDHVVNGVGLFEVHLGPRREFAIFRGVQDDHRDHESPDNLLKPFRVLMEGGRARQHWDVPSLKVALTVTLAGGSFSDCESWYVVLEPLEKTH
jgi:hypothetical protein